MLLTSSLWITLYVHAHLPTHDSLVCLGDSRACGDTLTAQCPDHEHRQNSIQMAIRWGRVPHPSTLTNQAQRLCFKLLGAAHALWTLMSAAVFVENHSSSSQEKLGQYHPTGTARRWRRFQKTKLASRLHVGLALERGPNGQ